MSPQDFQLIFESAPGAYLILTPQLSIAAVTNAYLQATMTKREDILNRSLFEVFPDNPDEPSATGTSNLRASLQRVLQTKSADKMPIQKYDIRKPAAEGGGFEERYWSPLNVPAFGPNREVRFILHCVEDVTEFVKLKLERMEQHRVTEELRIRVDEMDKLRQSQKMEALGQLAGGIAHDFNNILSIIIMNCELLLSAEPSPSVKKGLEQITSTSERAATLTRQLLAFSRKQVLQPKTLNLNPVIQNLESMLNRVLNADITLETKLAPDLGFTIADTGQIEQILLNLIVNARDAMPKGGKILIETANTELDLAMAAGHVKAEPGPYIMLAVRDSGVGMDAKTQARIFEPFFTTKGMGRGTGLGLSTIFGIVNQSKGTIWVYSEPLRGTTFKIFLPRADQVISEAATEFKEISSIKGKETVIVVEDQEQLRELICTSLRNHGYTVFEAENGAKALTLLQEKLEMVDLVITDVVIPEMSGRVLSEKLFQIRRDIKILYVSGYTEDTLIQYGVSGKSPHFLEKPFTQLALLKKVRTILIQ